MASPYPSSLLHVEVGVLLVAAGHGAHGKNSSPPQPIGRGRGGECSIHPLGKDFYMCCIRGDSCEPWVLHSCSNKQKSRHAKKSTVQTTCWCPFKADQLVNICLKKTNSKKTCCEPRGIPARGPSSAAFGRLGRSHPQTVPSQLLARRNFAFFCFFFVFLDLLPF